ncbi:hypothetical protein IID21_03080 [Patescibacteria group bacterium]|nr:hypothetical protein [Patescibacteria group bacterium]
MSREIDSLHELSTRDLVSLYISIPLNNQVTWPDLASEVAHDFKSISEETEDVVKLVQNGLLDIDAAEKLIIEAHESLAERYPEYKKEFNFSQLFTRAKAWIGQSIVIDRKEGRSETFKSAQENVARLILQVEVSANTRRPILATYLYQGLLHSGLINEAEQVAEKTFVDVIIVESPEEARAMARKFGETDPINIQEGVASVPTPKSKSPYQN